MYECCAVFFFFSSRRRHTRCSRDWSSDVCSSDLETGQPLLATGEQIVGGEGIGEFLQGLRIGTLQESVRALLKADATLSHAQGQPVMLIETDASGEGKIGAHPYEHLSPTGVLDIEVVLLDPAPLQL